MKPIFKHFSGDPIDMLKDIKKELDGLPQQQYMFSFGYVYKGDMLMAEKQSVIHDVMQVIDETIGNCNIVAESYLFGSGSPFYEMKISNIQQEETHVSGTVASA